MHDLIALQLHVVNPMHIIYAWQLSVGLEKFHCMYINSGLQWSLDTEVELNSVGTAKLIPLISELLLS